MECVTNTIDNKTRNFTTIAEMLERNGWITYKIEGKSMMPMLIPNQDIVTIQKRKTKQYFENDVVLYWKKDKLVLHRIIKVLPNNQYVLLGDNCSKKEYGITESDIIGVLTSFRHNGEHYDISNIAYQNYIIELRKFEKHRMRRKFIYDFISWHLNYLPQKYTIKIKTRLYHLLNYQVNF